MRSWAPFLAAAALVGAACGRPDVRLPRTDLLYEFALGRAEFERRHYLEARTHLKRFVDLNPGHAVADSAQLLIGLCLFHTKSYAESAVEFAILAREYPRSPLRDDAGYYECLSYAQQMRPIELDPTFATRADNCWADFLLRYPDTGYRDAVQEHRRDIGERMAEKDFRLGVLFARMKKPRAARIYLEGVLREHPRSRWIPDCLLWIGRSQEQEGDPAAAAGTYRRLLEGFPDDDASSDARARLRDLLRRHPELDAAPEGAARSRP